MGKTEVYELLCILDFNNVRKRMSVILRHDGKIRLYCKGADSIIYDHLAPGNDINKNKTQVTSLTKKKSYPQIPTIPPNKREESCWNDPGRRISDCDG